MYKFNLRSNYQEHLQTCSASEGSSARESGISFDFERLTICDDSADPRTLGNVTVLLALCVL